MNDSDLVVRAPFGGRELARVPRPSSEEVEAAVQRAVRVFQETRALPAFTRVAILRKVAAELERRRDELARLRSARRPASP